MNILGISAFYHDSAACLVRDGQIIAAAQEERFSRIKHDASLPLNAIRYCLEEGRCQIKDLDYIAFYDKPFLKFERLLETYLAYAPRGLHSFLTAIPVWIKNKIWLKDLIARKLNYSGQILFSEHHLSHAASAFYPSPFKTAAFLTIDGVGEWTTTSFGIGQNHQIKIIEEIKFPHSLGLLYSAFTYFTGFKVNSGEYKLMGLAPYGRPVYRDLILKKLVDLKTDGSFRLNLDYFNYPVGFTMTNRRFSRLFGRPPRHPESSLTESDLDLARSIQDVTEEIIVRLARHVRARTSLNNLCLAGGVALNCVANRRLLQEKIFDSLWIQPAAGDAGGALGAALAVWYDHLQNPRSPQTPDSMQGSLLGPAYSNNAIESFLTQNRLPALRLTPASLPPTVAALLAAEHVIGWFQGRMEFGPRALGNRSILGDARSPQMQKIMNLKIKFRESFRPFAPSVLEEDTPQYFDFDLPSPYMLLTAPIQTALRLKPKQILTGTAQVNEIRSTIPAVTHVDYSARLQTVNQKTNPLYWQLIKSFHDLTGCAVIINTSFNVRGEPIVCSPEDAYKCFMRTNLDYLVLGHFLLNKKDQPTFHDSLNWKTKFTLD